MHNVRVKLLVTFLCVLFPLLTCGQEKNAASAIIIDNTGSMRPMLEYVLAIGGDGATQLSRRGPVSVFSFEYRRVDKKDFATLNAGSAWLSDSKKLWEKLNAIRIEPGQTQLIDAIDTARQVVASKLASDKLAEGIIFVITDGDERSSDLKVKTLVENLKRDRIKVFAVGMIDDLPDKKNATKLLKQLASESGGNVVFPKFKELQTLKSFEVMITGLFATPGSSK